MKIKIGCLTLILLIFIFEISLYSIGGFEKVTRWDHKDQGLYDEITGSLIDKDGHIVAMFGRNGIRLITPEKVLKFALEGLGPNDIYQFMAMSNHDDGIAIVEFSKKVKIFEKSDGTYKIKDVKWLKRGYQSQVIKSILYFDQKWFVTGSHLLIEKPDFRKYSMLTIHDNSGKELSELIDREYNQRNRYYEIKKFVSQKKGRIFFIMANEPELIEIDPNKLTIKETYKLDVPQFYKKMPHDFYAMKRYDFDSNDYIKDLEFWETNYSSISNMVVDGNFLILQMRTSSKELKRSSQTYPQGTEPL